MGDRINVKLIYECYEERPIYFYSHWGGRGIRKRLQDALIRGKDRWGDDSYLARIIFSEIIQDEVMSLTGYGIAPYECDPQNPTIKVDLGKGTVDGMTFEEFCRLEL